MADAPNNGSDPSNANANGNGSSSTGADPNKGKEGDPGSGGNADPQNVPYDRFKEVNTKLKETNTELERYREDERKRKEKEAIDKGEHEKVINDLRPKAERAEALEKTINTVIESELAAIPKERHSLVPDLPAEKKLAWIAANRAFLMGEKKKDTNHPTNPADGSGGGGDNQTFTKAQIEDPKFYAEHRDDILKAMREGRIRD